MWRPALIVTIYLVGWFVLNRVTEGLQGELEVSIWYPPSGLSFALLLVFGVRYAPALVLTTFALYLLFRGGMEYPVWVLLSLPVLYTAVYAGAATLLVGWVKIDPRLARMRDVLYFVGIGCLAAPFLASAVTIAGYSVAGRTPWSDFVFNVLGGGAGEATSVGVLATLILIALRPFPYLWSFGPVEPLRGFEIPERREVLELLGQTLLLAATLFVAYGTDRGVRLDFTYLVFLPLLWVALRDNLARTVLCVLVINVGAVLLVGGTVENANPVLIQLGLVTLTLVGLLLGGLVTGQRETSARLVWEASHDRLTGLPNRTLFLDALSEALTRRPESAFAVLAVDLDRFANVNNALGHRMGDRLLVAVAGRLSSLSSTTKDFKVARVARIGGDAFAVLTEDSGLSPNIGHQTGQLLRELARPYKVSGREVYVTASAGVVPIEENPEELEDLLRDADTAVQAAKSKGPSCYVVFDRAMGEAAKRHLELDTDLRRAIEREEFTLHYQPVFSLKADKIVGAEALVRWEHPERGLLGPTEFIALAEQSGLIVQLGDWVLREACHWAKGCQELNSSQSPITVNVNLSAKQLERPNFAENLRSTLEETGLDPHMLVLEITEGMLVDGADSIRETLNSLREHGVSLAVDDFGTGYSSLSYLSRFPVNVIKIDRSFISKLSRDNSAQERSADEKLVSGIIALAHNQGLVVVGEGVEDDHQLERLQKTSCDMVQGFCISKPLAGEKISALIESKSR